MSKTNSSQPPALYIPVTAAVPTDFTPPSIKDTEHDMRFVVSIPTPSERERLGARLYAYGVVQVSQELMRATTIDELYNLFPEEEAEDKANFLDTYWQRQIIDEENMTLWTDKERQRILDEMEGAPARAAYEMPIKLNRIRDDAKATMLVDEAFNRSERLRTLGARQINYAREAGRMQMRMHIKGCFPNAKGAPVPAIDIEGDLLTVASLDAIRDAIGEAAWKELIDHIQSLYDLDREEVGNSDSLPGKPPEATGSPEPSGDSASSDGPSTTSNIGATPSGESATTIAPSSPSTSSAAATPKKAGPTAKAA